MEVLEFLDSEKLGCFLFMKKKRDLFAPLGLIFNYIDR
jgi:hypothetical protein